MEAKMERRNFCRSMAGITVGIGSLVGSTLLPLRADEHERESLRVRAAEGEIYELQAAFHRAKSTQDIDLMMSLWAEDASLTIIGDPNSPYIGFDKLKSFLLSTGSFTHRRFSLVPSFKIQIDVHGDEAFLYFECHDIGDFDLPSRFIAGDTFVGATVRRVEGKWVFWNATSGKASPISVDHYYFP
jgi:hypothetical protein